MAPDYPACRPRWHDRARYSKRVPEINAPSAFVAALDSLRGHSFRSEIHIVQIPPPKRIAPWAVALQAEINDSPSMDPDHYRGNARFVLLHDPEGQTAWDGTFRIVCYASAPVDREIGDDPMLSEVAWAWLTDALNAHEAEYHNLTGTVTRLYNETFGGSSLLSSHTEVELRASWSPEYSDVSAHLQAWAEFASDACGLGPAGVSALPLRLQEME